MVKKSFYMFKLLMSDGNRQIRNTESREHGMNFNMYNTNKCCKILFMQNLNLLNKSKIIKISENNLTNK